MAPMFLISNVRMTKAGMKYGIAACIPALNFRTEKELRNALQELSETEGCYGINLVVNKTNYKLNYQLKACLDYKVPFIITSLGKPKTVIDAAKAIGIKVFCDVSDMEYANKTASYHPDAMIAVTAEAGGHLGPHSGAKFIPQLIKSFPDIPIIGAGGVGDAESYSQMLDLGVSGVSIGTVFIASEESPACLEYKEACVRYGADDVVTTKRLSGIPCTVINTPYIQKLGLEQNTLEKLLSKSKLFKKTMKLITYLRGMEKLRKSAFSVNYNTVWCAGKSIRFTHAIQTVKQILDSVVGRSN